MVQRVIRVLVSMPFAILFGIVETYQLVDIQDNKLKISSST
jgi:hypothetical protein